MNNYTTLNKMVARRTVTKRVKVDPPATGYRTVQDGLEDYGYRVEIDWSAVRGMAGRAAHSKGGKSKAGPIRVIVTNRKRVQ